MKLSEPKPTKVTDTNHTEKENDETQSTSKDEENSVRAYATCMTQKKDEREGKLIISDT